MPCYTWRRNCLTLPDPCSFAIQQQACTPQIWFWLLASALGVAALVRK